MFWFILFLICGRIIAIFGESCLDTVAHQCMDQIDSGISNNEKYNILSFHNNIRYLALKGGIQGQPQAYKLHNLKWDSCLAAEAQRFTDSCGESKRNHHRCSYNYIGQNSHTTLKRNYENPNWNETMLDWFRGNKHYVFGPIESNINSKAALYTQLVWDKTTHVGCGRTTWLIKLTKTNTEKYATISACMYGPGGNLVGAVPY